MLLGDEVVQDLCTLDPFFSVDTNMPRNVNFGGARGGVPAAMACGGLPEVVQDFVRQQ